MFDILGSSLYGVFRNFWGGNFFPAFIRLQYFPTVTVTTHFHCTKCFSPPAGGLCLGPPSHTQLRVRFFPENPPFVGRRRFRIWESQWRPGARHTLRIPVNSILNCWLCLDWLSYLWSSTLQCPFGRSSRLYEAGSNHIYLATSPRDITRGCWRVHALCLNRPALYSSTIWSKHCCCF